jgi:hypothetical protein
MVRYTVAEAADMLGISTGAVRNRLSRGTLPSTKEDRAVYVLLPADMSRDAERDADGMPPGMPHSDSDVLTSELRDRLRYVEGQLEAERQAHAEARRIIAGLVERIPAIEAPQEERESPETVEEAPERAEPRPATGELREELDTERTRRETAESTMHEGMAEERRRREEAEQERDDLRRELYALREPREATETGEDQQGRGEPHSATGGAQEGARRPWWKRVFRG